MSQPNTLEIRFRHGKLEELNVSEEIPFPNEIILIKEPNKEMEPLFKLGDGIHTIKELPYVSWDYAFRNGFLYIRGAELNPIQKVKINLDA